MRPKTICKRRNQSLAAGGGLCKSSMAMSGPMHGTAAVAGCARHAPSSSPRYVGYTWATLDLRSSEAMGHANALKICATQRLLQWSSWVRCSPLHSCAHLVFRRVGDLSAPRPVHRIALRPSPRRSMDFESGSIFDDLTSPVRQSSASRSDPTPSDLDLLPLTDPLPDWDRALLHPPPLQLPPTSTPRRHLAHSQHPSQPSYAPLPALDSEPSQLQPSSSVDDTSPAQLPASARPARPARPARHPRSTSRQSKQEPELGLVRGNVSHTRRCRAKVNNRFERLLEALPPPPEGVEVKHKAQILAYAIDRFRFVRCHNIKLEMQLALSSSYQMHRWVKSVVSATNTLQDALKSFMALICLTRNWKYAELWMPYFKNEDHRNPALKYISGALPPTVEGEELLRLRTYREQSRKYVFEPRSGVPGRVFLTMRPEWLPLLNDPVAFPRAPHAVRNKVEVTFAVPVIINGSVQMVVEFFDTEKRDYDPDVLHMANEVACMFGKAFSGRL